MKGWTEVKALMPTLGQDQCPPAEGATHTFGGGVS